MALGGFPVEVISGMATGLSASFFTLVELENDSTLASALFGSKTKAVVTSSVGSFLVGYLVNPLAGITFEVFFYPACWLKSKQVEKALKKIAREGIPGSEHEVEFPKGSGQWHKVKVKEGDPIADAKYGVASSY